MQFSTYYSFSRKVGIIYNLYKLIANYSHKLKTSTIYIIINAFALLSLFKKSFTSSPIPFYFANSRFLFYGVILRPIANLFVYHFLLF